MELESGNAWGKLTGKLSTTPEIALSNWGFVQDPTAKGIIFRRYTAPDCFGRLAGKCYINNYRPPENPRTPAQVEMRDRFAVISRMAQELKNDITVPVWNPIAKKKPHSTGYNEFRSRNLRQTGQPPDWTKLRIAEGILSPGAGITAYYYDPGEYTKLKIIFDTQEGEPTDVVNAYYFLRTEAKLYKLNLDTTYTRGVGYCLGETPDIYPLQFIIVFIFFSRQ